VPEAAIDAELTGSTECSARGITVRGSAPVLALCRALIGAGYDPRRPLHVFRGQTLALKVRSISEGSRFTVADTHGRPRIRRMAPQDWVQKARPLPLTAGRKHNGNNGSGKSAATLESASASSFKIVGLRWLWPNRFALGKLALIAGLPDRGKGLITADMIARVTTGGQWPCKEGSATKGRVLILSAEDDIEDTIIPRLAAVGADLSLVEIVRMVRVGEAKRMFSLVRDLELLRRKVEELGDVVMVDIDPLSAYLGVGKIDSFRTTDVRSALAPLTEFAAEKRVLILGVLHFNKKADVTNAMLRISDSLAFAVFSG
jgi:hypothetical protein